MREQPSLVHLTPTTCTKDGQNDIRVWFKEFPNHPPGNCPQLHDALESYDFLRRINIQPNSKIAKMMGSNSKRVEAIVLKLRGRRPHEHEDPNLDGEPLRDGFDVETYCKFYDVVVRSVNGVIDSPSNIFNQRELGSFFRKIEDLLSLRETTPGIQNFIVVAALDAARTAYDYARSGKPLRAAIYDLKSWQTMNRVLGKDYRPFRGVGHGNQAGIGAQVKVEINPQN